MYKEALKRNNFDKNTILKEMFDLSDIDSDCPLCEYSVQQCDLNNTNDPNICIYCPVGVDWQVGDKGTESNLYNVWCTGYGSPYLDLIRSVDKEKNYIFESDSDTVKHLNGCIEVLEKAKRELE